ncbi:MAG: cystathionine beta-synthase [Candidatus Zixiibacteriota bacterium]|nr:MAG: cystathionine beta-synthase [candidate division Zixibacteria bacterium]
MSYLENILKAIGNTPLVKLNKLAPKDGPTILVKPEYLNPAGSIKDRMAHYLIEQAEKEGLLKPGGTIVENTSGNTGAGVAMIAAVKGYKAIFTMPDKMSSEKIDLLRAFGARVVITPTDVPADSPQSYYETAKRIARETPNSFYLNQYHNKNNIEAHYRTTGPEIYEQTAGKITHLVGGIGTGGTISGAGRYLKEKDPNIKVIAVDPEGSVFYDYFKTGKLVEPHAYKVEGIGEDMMTGAMDFSVVDDVIKVNDRDCFMTARELVRKEGIFAGGSSGGAIHAALKVAKTAKPDDIIVVILPDSGMRYLSKIFNDQWMTDNGFLIDDTMSGTVADLLTNGRMEPVIVDSKSTIRDAIELMKKYDISQLPVSENGDILGMVYEIDLLRALASRSGGPDDPVRDVAERNFSTVSSDDSITTLARIFTESNDAVLVMNGNELKAILTRIDLITFLSGNDIEKR